jgi:iron complex outermembrane receptor protein
VVNFRSRKGRDIRGMDIGADVGSYGYSNNYFHAGNRYEHFEYSLFASYVRGDGYIDHSAFRTTTQNLTLTFTPDDKRTVTVKYLNNDLKADVPSRLTLDQYNLNPSTQGMTSITGGPTVSADRTAQNREDRRTIIGARYEHAISPQTGFRFMGDYDVKDINQTFGTISDNVNPNFQQSMDLTHEGQLFGVAARHYAGMFFNFMEQEASTYRNLADYNGTRGALQANTRGYHRNVGGRVREEIAFDDRWTGILGVGVESSDIRADVQTRTGAETYSRVSADRRFFNAAPEGCVIFAPSPDLKFRGRVGMAYGTPSISQLTTTPAGVSGNNTSINPQRNLGFELATEGKLFRSLSFDLAGYYEFFYDEFVTQSPGAGLSNYTNNAPRSEHRGVEAALDFRPWKGLFASAAYSFNDHRYTDFMETIGAGVTLDRAGKEIPGVERQVLNSRLGYETEERSGGWVELVRIEPFFVNNSNTLEVPPVTVFNVNAHYSKAVKWGWIDKITLFTDVRNVFDQKYIGSAVVVADATTDAPANLPSTKQAFFAGQAISVNGGVKVSF